MVADSLGTGAGVVAVDIHWGAAASSVVPIVEEGARPIATKPAMPTVELVAIAIAGLRRLAVIAAAVEPVSSDDLFGAVTAVIAVIPIVAEPCAEPSDLTSIVAG